MKDSGSAHSYYDWVDQFDTLGPGKNTPIITGNSSDSLIALVNGKFVVMRVPYPLGSLQKAWMAELTMRTPAGKGKELRDRASGSLAQMVAKAVGLMAWRNSSRCRASGGIYVDSWFACSDLSTLDVS
jgi:hypothetical protein